VISRRDHSRRVHPGKLSRFLTSSGIRTGGLSARLWRAAAGAGGPAIVNSTSTADFKGNIVGVGVNYHWY
jgi:hypothetical protein